jgi:CRP-like cAMP-binding protein
MKESLIFPQTRKPFTSSSYYRGKSHSSDSQSSRPEHKIFPVWLQERRDFQDTIKEYDLLGSLNICEICSKPASVRSPVEIKALENWSNKIYFFKGMGKNTRTSICERLKAKYFNEGSIILPRGSTVETVYFIVKGRVSIDTEGVIIELGPNNLLGERELMRSSEITSTIQSKTSLECVSLSKHDFDILAFKNRLKEQYIFKEKLKQCTCFKDLKLSKIEQLCNSIKIIQFSQNESVFDVLSPSSFLYYIEKGSVVVDLLITLQKINNWPAGKLLKETLLTEERYARKVKEFKTGDFFGEREFILNIARETKAYARQDRTVLFLFSKKDFYEILNEKEIKDFLSLNEPRLASPEVAKKLKDQIVQYKKKFVALMEASNIKRVKKGRALWDESISRRKDNYAKELIFRHTQKMKGILKERTFSVTLSPRQTISTFYNFRQLNESP